MSKLIARNLKLDPFTHSRIQELANSAGVSMDDLVQEVLINNLEQRTERPEKHRPRLKRVK